MLGLPVGVGLSYAVSGAVAQAWGWRATFVVAGAPGLLLALACLALPDPPRGSSEEVAVGARRRPGSAVGLLAHTPTFLWIVLSGALHNFNMYALSTFVPAFLTRHHGLTVGEAGLASGVIFGLVGGIGMMAGGVLGDRMAARRPSGRLLAAFLCLASSVPLTLLVLRQPSGAVAATLAWLAAAVLVLYGYYAPVYATLQDIVEPAIRGTSMAVYFFAMYMLGASMGPVGTGVLSDWFAVRAAAQLGVSPLSEAARSAGLRHALFVVPALGAALAVVLALATRTVARDRRALSEWMRADAA
jgi:predicted MFS family arabinose efflux permease